MSNLSEEIFQSTTLRQAPVEVFGRQLAVRQMSAERMFQLAGISEHSMAVYNAIGCLVDPETGDYVFTPAQADKVAKLPSADIMKINRAVQSLDESGTPPEKNSLGS